MLTTYHSLELGELFTYFLLLYKKPVLWIIICLGNSRLHV